MGLNSRQSEFPDISAQALEKLPLPTVMIDGRYTAIWSNRAWQALSPAHASAGDYVQAWSAWNAPEVTDSLRTWIRCAMDGDASPSAFPVLYGPDSVAFQVQAVPVGVGAQTHLLLTHTPQSGREPSCALPPAAEVHADEAMYQGAFQSSCIGAAILALDGQILEVNSSFCRLTGHGQSELLHRSFPSMTHVHDRDLWQYEIRRLVRQELPRVQITHRIQRRNGTTVWVLLSAALLRERPDAPAHIIAQVQDISDRYRAEEEIRRQALTFENISDALILTREQGDIVDWNPAAERMLGFAGDEVMNTSIRLLVAPESFPLLALVQQHLHNGQRWEGEIRLRRKDGASRVCEGVVAPLMEEESGALTAMYFLRDVTEARQLEAQLQHAQKMEAVGQLAGGVAHDFNNLLTIIKGHSVQLLDDFPSDTPQRQRLLQIAQAVERAAALTGQLLAYSRRQVLTPRLFDLNAVAGNLAPMLRRLINEDIEVEFQLSDAPLWVKADAGQIDQVILNLTVNARDAIPQRGKITIETSVLSSDRRVNATTLLAAGMFVMLSVSDTGVGMSPEVQAHIFDPFFTTKQQGQGTGLGLAMVYGIIRQSGGYIQVSSIPGKGSCFNIYLPRAEAPLEEVRPAHDPASLAKPGEETILVVEDEEGVRSLICDVLSQLGYRVLEASGSEAALRHAAEHRGAIDLMVTDVVMPRMGGRELAQRMAALRPRMRVLYISGYTDDAVVRHGVQESRMAFLQKPFSPSQLGHKVREVLAGPAHPALMRS